MTHICVSKLTIIGSDNGLSPSRRQAIIWTNAGILLIGLIGTNFSEILIKILTSSFKKMRLKVSSAKRRPFCLGLNVLNLISKGSTIMAACQAALFTQWGLNRYGRWMANDIYVAFFKILFLYSVGCGLSMWEEMLIPMYRLWLHGLYGLHGPWYLPSEKGS